ncbi:MAG: tetratricopeptide repeat protein [Chthoniobacterales bacterium]
MKSLWRRLPQSLRAVHYLFAFVLLLRLIVLARLTISPFLLPTGGDMHFYDEWAKRILHGDFTDGHAFYGLPLYGYLLALIYKIAGYGPFVPGFLQAMFDAGTAVLIYNLGHRVFLTRLFPLVAALSWAFFIPAQAYTAILMPTSLFVFVFWLVVWRVVRSDFKPSFRECLALGLLIGLVAMGVATILFLLPLVLASLLIKQADRTKIDNRKRQILAGVAVLLAGVTIGIAPCWLHNYFVARDPVLLSAHSGINFWIGNNPEANGYPSFPPGLHAGQQAMLEDSITQAEATAGRPLKRSEVSAYWSAKAKDYIGHHPSEWLKLVALKVCNFWSAFQYDDLSIITVLREEGVIFPGLSFGVIAALALPGMFLAWRSAPNSRWIVGAILLLMAALLTVFITERYRLAAVPGLLLFAGFGCWAFWKNVAAQRLAPASVYVALLLASTIFVAWPQRDPALWALDAYNSGRQALESNNLLQAEKKLALAYSYVPENAETNFALGNLYLARHENSRAKSFYAVTLRLDPSHTGAYNNLGLLALEENQSVLAADLFSLALRRGSHSAKNYYLLAEAHFKSGKIDDARSEIGEAIKLSPAQPEFRRLRDQIEQAQSRERP